MFQHCRAAGEEPHLPYWKTSPAETTRTCCSGQALGFCQDFLNTPSQLKFPLSCLAVYKADWDWDGAGKLASRIALEHPTAFNEPPVPAGTWCWQLTTPPGKLDITRGLSHTGEVQGSQLAETNFSQL